MSPDPIVRRPVAPRRSPFHVLGLAALLLVGLAGAGCKGTTPIREILDDPSRFADQKVRIAGDVTSAVGVFGTGLYQVDDGTGQLAVVAKGGGVPREGARVAVEGKIRPGFTLGTQTLTVMIEERRGSK